jgi:hypothetical protein
MYECTNTLFLKYLTADFDFFLKNVGLSGAWAPYAQQVETPTLYAYVSRSNIKNHHLHFLILKLHL